ncbi:gustatory receptor trehalose 1 [Elysia marginata]|uniref:Gustatory receptor trehalose 1 n=1 Tax=Elysia marginata TaxID=1093978 RepID=A0AAV4HSU6_9GAST|nr:gustatory receptor trehalose 1 [Elysia marginata]
MFGSDVRVANAAISMSLATLGTVGNALSIGLICSGGLPRSAPTMALILGMCTANLVSTSLLLPVVGTSNLHGMWILGSGLCQAYGYIVYVTLTAESLQLLALTLAQYFTVVHRVTSYELRRHLPELVGVPWLAACLIYLVPLTGLYEKFGYDPRRGYCTLLSSSGVSGGDGGVYVMLLSVFFSAVMTLVNVYCYSAIMYVTHQSRRRTTTSVLEAAARFKGRVRDVQLLRMTTIIFVNFGVTYLPFLVMLAMDPCLERISPAWFTFILYVSWSHAVTNPVIYALMNTRINRLWTDFCRRGKTGRGANSKSAPDLTVPRCSEILAHVEPGQVSGEDIYRGKRNSVTCVMDTHQACTCTCLLPQDWGDIDQGSDDGPSLIVIVKAVMPVVTHPAVVPRKRSQCQAHTNLELEIRSHAPLSSQSQA